MRSSGLTSVQFACLLGLSLFMGCGSGDMNSSQDLGRSYESTKAAAATGLEFDDERVVDASQNQEEYESLPENDFVDALQNPQSTFSIDVDTASYSNVRRMLNENRIPPPESVRIEEMINYFRYDYPQPTGKHPFAVLTDVNRCPWNPNHQLVRVALKGKEIHPEMRPSSNLVFLLDVSGSMNASNKLPLVKTALKMLLSKLDDRDYISIVVYAGASGVVLPPTGAHQRGKIISALDRLQAGGSTNGGSGIQLAYRIAQDHFIEGGINRVILCTDGDFNLGLTSRSGLQNLIEEKAKSNVFLSVLGFGTGNYKDHTMEQLADKGNGNFAYIDSVLEARKSLVAQMESTLITIAKDVKIQIDFNPTRIAAYRLIGYENRLLENRDFEDDTKDAGEIGAGHTVTALYEIVPAGVESPAAKKRESKFVKTKLRKGINPNTLLNVAVRYKLPDSNASTELGTSLEHPAGSQSFEPSTDFRFASAVAAYGMLLRNSQFAGEASMQWVIETAQSNLGTDRYGFRAEFVALAKKAQLITSK